jgi:hypothetical protein
MLKAAFSYIALWACACFVLLIMTVHVFSKALERAAEEREGEATQAQRTANDLQRKVVELQHKLKLASSSSSSSSSSSKSDGNNADAAMESGVEPNTLSLPSASNAAATAAAAVEAADEISTLRRQVGSLKDQLAEAIAAAAVLSPPLSPHTLPPRPLFSPNDSGDESASSATNPTTPAASASVALGHNMASAAATAAGLGAGASTGSALAQAAAAVAAAEAKACAAEDSVLASMRKSSEALESLESQHAEQVKELKARHSAVVEELVEGFEHEVASASQLAQAQATEAKRWETEAIASEKARAAAVAASEDEVEGVRRAKAAAVAEARKREQEAVGEWEARTEALQQTLLEEHRKWGEAREGEVAERSQLEASLASLIAQLEASHANEERSALAVQSLEEKLSEANAHHRTASACANDEVAASASRIAALEGEVAELSVELSGVKAALEAAQAEGAVAQQKLSSAQTELASAVKAVEAANLRAHASEEQGQYTRFVAEGRASELYEAQMVAAAHEAEKLSLADDVQRAKVKAQDLAQRLVAAESVRHTLERQLADRTRELEGARYSSLSSSSSSSSAGATSARALTAAGGFGFGGQESDSGGGGGGERSWEARKLEQQLSDKSAMASASAAEAAAASSAAAEATRALQSEKAARARLEKEVKRQDEKGMWKHSRFIAVEFFLYFCLSPDTISSQPRTFYRIFVTSHAQNCRTFILSTHFSGERTPRSGVGHAQEF